ncbi:MAG TPA: hypothetical protein VGD64_05145 [Acidisarcina sp.]
MAKSLKYVFAASTTLLSILSLRHDTTFKEDDQTKLKRLTPVGRWYQVGVLTLALTTILASIAEDKANRALTSLANRRADQKLQAALDGQLNSGIKPILQNLQEEVNKTSKSLNDGLRDESRRSSAQIQSSQRDVLGKTERSSEELSEVAGRIEASKAQLGQMDAGLTQITIQTQARLIDMQKSLLEANFRVTSFIMDLSAADERKSAGRANWAETDAVISKREEAICKGQAPTYIGTDNSNVCNGIFRSNKTRRETHKFAELLYPDNGFTSLIQIGLSNLHVNLWAYDCAGLNQPAGSSHTPEPCLRGPSIYMIGGRRAHPLLSIRWKSRPP